MPVCEIDFRIGGKWRFVSRSPQGFELASQGTYTAIHPPAGIEQTERYDDNWTQGGTVNAIAFVEKDGVTTATTTLTFTSPRGPRAAAAASPTWRPAWRDRFQAARCRPRRAPTRLERRTTYRRSNAADIRSRRAGKLNFENGDRNDLHPHRPRPRPSAPSHRRRADRGLRRRRRAVDRGRHPAPCPQLLSERRHRRVRP